MDRFKCCTAARSNLVSLSIHRYSVSCLMRNCALAGLALVSLGSVASLTGCTTDEVGRSKTTTKETINSPTQKSTVTETKTKETTFTPR